MSPREPFAVRVYRFVLGVFPGRIRHIHGDEMAAMFHASWTDARRSGAGATLRLLFRTVFDVALNGSAARLGVILGLDPAEPRSPSSRSTARRRGGMGMETVLRNLKHAIRGFAHRPGFALVAVLTLGLGIGGNTAIFSIVSALLLKPLPYRDPSALVTLNHYYPSLDGLEASISARGFRDYKTRTHAFSSVAVETGRALNLTGEGDPERINAASASPDYFRTLGVAPALGRAYGKEVEGGDAHVVVLSHGFWARRFGSDPDALGRTLNLDGDPYTIIGVMPETFRDVFNRQAQLWVPLVLTEAQYSRGYTNEYLSLVARLAPDTGIGAARTEMAAFADQLKTDHPDWFPPDWSIHVTSLQERATESVRPALMILLGAVLVVLLIACANVASLLLTRASGQRRQIAVRMAMGAGRSQVVGRLLSEGVVLGLAGAAVGLVLGTWGLVGLKALASRSVPGIADVSMDRGVLLFTLLVSVGTGVFVGLMPAIGTWRTNVSSALRDGTRAGEDRSGLRLRRVFVVAQLALSLALLAGAGLLLRSMARLQAVSPGFDAKGVETFYLSLPSNSYPDEASQRRFYDELLPALRSVRGVTAAGLESVLPFSGGWSTSTFTVVGYEPGPKEPGPWGDIRIVSPGFQEALGLPLLKGRFFTDADGPETPQVAVVDQDLVRRYWPKQDPIGKQISFGDGPIEVIGVVGHAAHEGLDADPRVQVYGSYRQFPRAGMFVVSRTSGRPDALAPALRAAVQTLDPNLPIARVSSMEHLIADSMGDRRLSLVLLAVFAAVALALASTGVYSVMAQMVGQRTRELGVRIAMGADRGAVISLVLRQGMGLVTVGTALGLAGSLAVSRVLESQLFGVTPTDPATYSLVVVVLLVSAALAILVPALRATRVDPVQALRQE
ncbi:MAG: ABC transporter permease [Gemmatimonadetes bacterium]|nr:ABC transporter permease [Gemmatimonadota bacterium]